MSRYAIFVTPAAWKEIKGLPARVRHRVRDAIEELADDPQPPKSKSLKLSDFPGDVRRLRLERWRILYAIVDGAETIDVLAVRKRPPYDYGDLDALLKDYPPK